LDQPRPAGKRDDPHQVLALLVDGLLDEPPGFRKLGLRDAHRHVHEKHGTHAASFLPAHGTDEGQRENDDQQTSQNKGNGLLRPRKIGESDGLDHPQQGQGQHRKRHAQVQEVDLMAHDFDGRGGVAQIPDEVEVHTGHGGQHGQADKNPDLYAGGTFHFFSLIRCP
jgi:hypothetical protein